MSSSMHHHHLHRKIHRLVSIFELSTNGNSQNGSKMVKILLPIHLKEHLLICEFARDIFPQILKSIKSCCRFRFEVGEMGLHSKV